MIADTLPRRDIDIQVLKNHFPSCRRMFEQVLDKKRSEAMYKQQKIDAEKQQAKDPKTVVFNFQGSTKISGK